MHIKNNLNSGQYNLLIGIKMTSTYRGKHEILVIQEDRLFLENFVGPYISTAVNINSLIRFKWTLRSNLNESCLQAVFSWYKLLPTFSVPDSFFSFFAEAVASFAESTLISDLLVVRRPVFGKCPGKVRMHNKCRVLRHAECVHKSKIGADQVN